MYEAETRGVRVTVTPEYQADKSDPADNRWFWAYTVEITNLGTEVVRLRARHWRIVDARGQIQEVSGPGVVGEQPILQPGESFEYTSGCPLATSSGFMVGHYRMETGTGDWFDAEIPAFSLDLPQAARVLN
ncbi:Co2+/Mg2+ efflux protein ApaG [Pinisolibacter aquiterrae]|uniref:Co2+/Mg2+ efflux protein ApaG n=1 Tax=Pinisolibacter aquiterrae TaxID=2815579 RepID=UPI001C3C7D6E|nr:Co2+/Mg2+ efflux protein ApaG [Pinisolibacter aquiterrae]MBV5266792.1 Co2+/Mg2+ efflux protein ApaG [Pinisolibacter aquiterrae]MCC8234894.1 Co2+/Mg2+ efflux protein ApaG [Pinisolibacter aquiterrae]